MQLCYSELLNVESHCSIIVKLNNSFLFHLTLSLSLSLSLFSVFLSPFSSFSDSLPHSHSISPSPTPYFSQCAVVACLWWILAWQGHGGGVFFLQGHSVVFFLFFFIFSVAKQIIKQTKTCFLNAKKMCSMKQQSS